jgi:hypothetical protein
MPRIPILIFIKGNALKTFEPSMSEIGFGLITMLFF